MDPSYRKIVEAKPKTRKTGQELLGLMIPNQRDVVPNIDETGEVDDSKDASLKDRGALYVAVLIAPLLTLTMIIVVRKFA